MKFFGKTYEQAYLTANGLDLHALMEAYLIGSVAFSQATGDYLSTELGPEKGMNADNQERYEGSQNYTAMEHHFDEAYGYLGASQFLLSADLERLRQGFHLDFDNDNTLSLKNEISFAFAQQMLQIPHGVEHLRHIVALFIEGRSETSARKPGYRETVKSLALELRQSWERGLARLALHQLDQLEKILNSEDEAIDFAALAKSFSLLKGFTLSFQFSPVSMLADSDFDSLHASLGDNPEFAIKSSRMLYLSKLSQVRNILVNHFELYAPRN